MSGIAFAGLYAVLGIPIARLADRTKRVAVIAVGMVLWSAMTSAAGLARNFWQLFLARAGVGIGEAALSPAAYSIVADYFPPEKLSRALSVYTLAIYFGMGAALLLGSLVVNLVGSLPPQHLPLVGRVYSWQLALVAVGTPGVFLAALMLTVREPQRRGQLAPVGGPATDAPRPPANPLVPYLRRRWRIYLPHMLGFALAGMYGNGLATWVPELFRRSWGWPVGRTGTAFGLILLLAGAPAVLLGGAWADRLRQRGHLGAPLGIAIAAIVPLGVAGVVLPLTSNPYVALALLAVCMMCFGIPGALAPSSLQLITPNEYRARVSAVFLLATTLIGSGFGPTVVALVNDYVFRDDASLRYSLSLVAGIAAPMSAMLLWAGLKPFRQAAAEMSGGPPATGHGSR